MEEMCKRLFWGALPLAGLLVAGCGGKFVCGDGAIETDKKTGAFETCDDGNTADGDGCSAKCQVEFDAQNHLCTLPAGFKNGFGGCCNSDADCLGGGQNGRACIDGACTTIGQCTSDADCNNALTGETHVAAPFPDGTTYKCVDFSADGISNFCLPGSGAACGNSADAPCPTGETCTIGFNQSTPAGGDRNKDGFDGVCMTDFLGSSKPGTFCDGASIYECSEGLLLFNNCIGNTCAGSCDGNDPNGGQACGDPNLTCTGPLGDVDLSGGQGTPLLFGGAGFCTGLLCGDGGTTPDFADENINQGACPAGFTCDFFGGGLNANDTKERYICQAEDAGGVATYQPCQQDRFFGKTCQDASQCLQAPPTQDNTGASCATSADCCPNGPDGCNLECAGANANVNPAVPGNCSPLPPDGFCGAVCDTTDTCQGLGDSTAICIDLPADNISVGFSIPLCFPFDQAFIAGTVTCQNEGDCSAVAGQEEGCLPIAISGIGDRALGGICTDLATAGAAGSGTACSNDAACLNGEICIGDNGTTQGKCTAVNVVGDACSAVKFDANGTACTTDADCTTAGQVCATDVAGGQGHCSALQTTCLSGLCSDHDGNIKLTDNSPSSTFCAGFCATNADCAANEFCQPVLTNGNNTTSAGDDTVIGLCQPLTTADPTKACTDATITTVCGATGLNSAGTLESCDDPTVGAKKTGACFTSGSVNGDDCKNDDDCNLGATCVGVSATTDGFCVVSGCDPNAAVNGADCGDANSECIPTGTGSPGICVHKCGADAECQQNVTTANAALTCQDTNGDGTVDGCLLP